jgi:hypothetical protein
MDPYTVDLDDPEASRDLRTMAADARIGAVVRTFVAACNRMGHTDVRTTALHYVGTARLGDIERVVFDILTGDMAGLRERQPEVMETWGRMDAAEIATRLTRRAS